MAKPEDVKNNPLFSMLSMTVGPEKAFTMVKEIMDKQEKDNQVAVESSTEVKKIVIPNSMNKLQASDELKRQYKDEETIINVDRDFGDWNWKDVLVAVKKAAEKHFGWVQGKTVMTFFGPERPREISVIVDIINGKKLTEDCFYGKFTASVWEDAVIDVGPDYISAEVKKRYSGEVKQFFDLIQSILDTESIYRGKSITVTKQKTPWGDESLNFDVFELKVSDKIVLNKDLEGVLQNFVIDDLGEEGKRCFLFSGGYGNAKTETAMRVGKAGTTKGMAFFYCKDADIFHLLLKQSLKYSPSIVFLEDLDEIGSGAKRDADMNRILNTLDGVQTKGSNLTVIFTTNHEKRINPALRRPGRIDLVMNFGNPSKEAIEKIYRIYLEELPYPGAKSLDYGTLAEATPECSGAVVAEIAKRAVKLCVKRGAVNEGFVQAAVDSMAHQLILMKEDVEEQNQGEMVIVMKNANIKSKAMNGEAMVFDQVKKS